MENYFFEIIIRDDFNAQKFVLQEFPNYQDKFFFHKYSKAISSSICRSLIKNKQDTKGFLDDEITSYIKEHDLYF